MQRGNLHGLIGRAGVGKTLVASNIAVNLVTSGHPVLFFSCEMSVRALTNRLLAIHLDLPAWSIEEKQRSGSLHPWVQETYEQGMWQLLVDDTAEPELAHIEQAIQEFPMHTNSYPAVVILDHSLLVSTKGMYGNEFHKHKEVVRQLKVIAKTHDVAVLTLLQAGRQSDSGAERNSGHLRITQEDVMGGIEMHLDVGLTVYRPELDPAAKDEALKYGDAKQQERYENAVLKTEMYRDQAMLGIAKNREGQEDVGGQPHHIDWRSLRVTPLGESGTLKEVA